LNGNHQLKTERAIAKAQVDDYLAKADSEDCYLLIGFIRSKLEAREYTRSAVAGGQDVVRESKAGGKE
jgi:hypothetical protein